MTVELASEHEAFLREVCRANEDLGERLRSLPIRALYDRDSDIFMILFGEPQEAITESVRNRFFLRLDSETLKIVGLEIYSLTRRLADDPVLRDLWMAA